MIVSGHARQDAIAARVLLSRYGDGEKLVFLINCNFDPLPRELAQAETVYGLLPLIARPKRADGENAAQPKVVVLRKFPKDWELFVDVDDTGFELVDSFSPRGMGTNKSPPMQ